MASGGHTENGSRRTPVPPVLYEFDFGRGIAPTHLGLEEVFCRFGGVPPRILLSPPRPSAGSFFLHSPSFLPRCWVLQCCPLVLSTYARWINRWENRLATRDANRVVRPFEWGLDWLGIPEAADPGARIAEYAAQAVRDSEAFFAYQAPADFRLEGSHLTFTSPLQTPFPENNTVHGEFFPCRGARGRAVLVMPPDPGLYMISLIVMARALGAKEAETRAIRAERRIFPDDWITRHSPNSGKGPRPLQVR